MANKTANGPANVVKTYTWHTQQPFYEVRLSETFMTSKGVMFNKSGEYSAYCYQDGCHYTFLPLQEVQRLKTATVTKHYD